MNKLIEHLRSIVGRDGVLSDAEELLVYECDGLTQHKARPGAVVFPHSTEEVARVVQSLARAGVPFAPRGAGTGLSGGALALGQSVVIELARMRRLLKLDVENRLAVVETGMVNAQLSRLAAPFGLHYVPDPSSGATCTIGGNIAENAGGIHCLKYGMTVDHVLAARVVLSNGEIVDLGNASCDATTGYDLLGVFIGSEGTFGIATEATVRLTPVPPAVRTMLADFANLDDGSRAVAGVIAAGIIPAALEMIDGRTIRAIEASIFKAGMPVDAEAALLVELDGLEAGLDEEAARTIEILRKNGARTVRLANDAGERKRLWAARKNAFGAMGRIAPDLMLQDAVVPRSRLPQVLANINRIGAKYDLNVANVFHAGDGNLHPFICFDSRNADEVRRVKEAGREMMEVCVSAGGTITGEHGTGLDKMEYLPMIFTPDDMNAMLSVRAAFDPSGLCNPGKIIPTRRSCGEARAASKAKNGFREPAERIANPAPPENELVRGDVMTTITRVVTQEASASGRFARASSLPLRSSQQGKAVSLTTKLFDADKAHYTLSQIISASESNIKEATSDDNALVVTPASSEELCETIKLAARERWTVAPIGAGSWIHAGNDTRADLYVSTAGLTRIIEHEPADLTVTAEAGITLSALNRELNRAGQWLPLDPPDDGRATVGGIAATNLAGAQSLGYGAPRSHVIGMRVVLADGRMIRAGGRVVKNVAGYDLVKLFTGSYGTLGAITELTFKLQPLPAHTTTIVARGSIDSLLRACAPRLLAAIDLFPVALELLSPQVTKKVLKSAPIDENDHALLLRFAGNEAAVADQVERARRLLCDELQGGTHSVDVHLADEDFWRGIAAIPLRDSNDLIWRASVLRTELHAFIRAAMGSAGGFARSDWHASVGAGRVRVMDSSPADVETCARALENLRATACARGGALVIEQAPREIKREIDVWWSERDGARFNLKRRIKHQLDPQNMFSPGRFDFS